MPWENDYCKSCCGFTVYKLMLLLQLEYRIVVTLPLSKLYLNSLNQGALFSVLMISVMAGYDIAL
mgnify:CR=1 FL=1